MLPFTLEQFLNVFATYNKAIWPAQIVAYVLGAIAVAVLLRRDRASDRVVSAVLGLMWLPFSYDHSFLNIRPYSASNPSSCLFSSRAISNSDKSRSFA